MHDPIVRDAIEPITDAIVLALNERFCADFAERKAYNKITVYHELEFEVVIRMPMGKFALEERRKVRERKAAWRANFEAKRERA